MSERDADASTQVISLGNGRYLVDDGVTRRIAYAVAQRDTWVFLDGRTYLIPAQETQARRSSAGSDIAALAAPMPATVVAINVAPGQAVTRGDALVVLEAMKMELAIQAPRDGVVKSVACAVGDLVQPGVPLLELAEPAPESENMES